jgi:hypothetical protein
MPLPSDSFPMTSSSFSYRKLKKLPPSSHQDDEHEQPAATVLQDRYRSYYRALSAAVARRKRRRPPGSGRAWGRRSGGGRLRRLRISSLARALRRKAAAVGGRLRASVAKVAARLREGRPYIGDLFAGNYMFLQVAPSPPNVAAGEKGVVPFTEYYYSKVRSRTLQPAPAAALPAVAAGVGDKGVAQ